MVKRALPISAVMALFLSLVPVATGLLPPAHAAGAGFSYLQAPFTQELYGVSDSFMGGVAFAPDGDPLVDHCDYGNSPLDRYDTATLSPPVNGTSTIHPSTSLPSGAGCGLTNHPNGGLYSNTSGGVVKLDANTGAVTGGPFGPAGNALGIAPDPTNGNLVYVESDGTIGQVNAALNATSTFSTVTTGNFVDGIYFDPSGSFLFMSNRSPSYQLTIVNHSGALVQQVPLTHEPDGIAFHSIAPKFVVVSSTDGTMTRFDFPNDDFTQTPVQTLFASGGFRGDLTQVGPDGCLYVTQDGTRYDNGTRGKSDSLVRICPGFASPPGVGGTATCDPPFTPVTIVNKNVAGNLSVSGPTLIDNVTVGGSISINPGADVFIRKATIGGNVQSNSAHSFYMVGSTMSTGTVSVNNTTGFTLVGQDENGCTGNQLRTTSLTGNTGGLEVSSNAISGNLVVTNNKGSSGSDFDGDPAGVEVEGNGVTARLACSGNVPVASNDSVSNGAGARAGECGAATF